MARMRSMKPEYYSDQEIAEELPGRDGRDARLLYPGLWGLADEHGRLRADPRWIKGQLFAYDDDLTPEVIDGLIDMIAATGRAVRYRVGSARYLYLPKLAKHQRLEPHKTPSRLPGIDEGEVEEARKPGLASESEPGVTSSEKFPDSSGSGASRPALKHVAGSREHVAGGMVAPRGQAREAPADAEPPPDVESEAGQAEQILAEWRSTLRTKPQRAIANAIGLIVQSALAEGQDPDHVREALKRWQAKGNLHHKTLPSLIHEVANGPRPGTDIDTRASPNGNQRPSTTDQRVADALAIADRLAAQEGAT